MKIRFEGKTYKMGAYCGFWSFYAVLLYFFAIYRLRDVSEVINVILAILTPFIYGLVMAYLLCPIYNFTVRSIYALTKRVNVNIPRPLTVFQSGGQSCFYHSAAGGHNGDIMDDHPGSGGEHRQHHTAVA